jgi:hypothetical protein
MDMKIFKNSYVVAIITFVLLYVIFYLFGIGYYTEIVDGKPVNKVSWKYPLGLALIIWVLWHFYIYPSETEPKFRQMDGGGANSLPYDNQLSPSRIFRTQPAQKINMQNWY